MQVRCRCNAHNEYRHACSHFHFSIPACYA